MDEVTAAELVTRFEQAVAEAVNLHRSYHMARLVPGTNSVLTGLFNAMEDAQAKRARYRREVLQALRSAD